ncbi:hypothetical protein D3C81_1485800 [compost metagenome]
MAGLRTRSKYLTSNDSSDSVSAPFINSSGLLTDITPDKFPSTSLMRPASTFPLLPPRTAVALIVAFPCRIVPSSVVTNTMAFSSSVDTRAPFLMIVSSSPVKTTSPIALSLGRRVMPNSPARRSRNSDGCSRLAKPNFNTLSSSI